MDHRYHSSRISFGTEFFPDVHAPEISGHSSPLFCKVTIESKTWFFPGVGISSDHVLFIDSEVLITLKTGRVSGFQMDI